MSPRLLLSLNIFVQHCPRDPGLLCGDEKGQGSRQSPLRRCPPARLHSGPGEWPASLSCAPPVRRAFHPGSGGRGKELRVRVRLDWSAPYVASSLER